MIFRNALSLSPFTMGEFEKGMVFHAGDLTAKTPAELQLLYKELGATEMYARIGTKVHATEGDADPNANIHTLDRGLELCRIAAQLDLPINPEIMCAKEYMDMFVSQAPDFHEYPEVYALQQGKEWSEMTIDEMCPVLKAYGEAVGAKIAETGCRVEHFNLGNEANFGFAGYGVGLKVKEDPELEPMNFFMAMGLAVENPQWLNEHIYKKQAKLFCALREGLRKYFPDASYGTHICLQDKKAALMQFTAWAENGYDFDDPGVSFYPSGPGETDRQLPQLLETAREVEEKFGKKLFIGEFSYPTHTNLDGFFGSWVHEIPGYPVSEEGQADLYNYLIREGLSLGISGVRYWGPDYSSWGPMALFTFDEETKQAFAKKALMQ